VGRAEMRGNVHRRAGHDRLGAEREGVSDPSIALRAPRGIPASSG